MDRLNTICNFLYNGYIIPVLLPELLTQKFLQNTTTGRMICLMGEPVKLNYIIPCILRLVKQWVLLLCLNFLFPGLRRSKLNSNTQQHYEMAPFYCPNPQFLRYNLDFYDAEFNGGDKT